MTHSYIVRVSGAPVYTTLDWTEAVIGFDKFQNIYEGCWVELILVNELGYESVELSGRV